MRYRKMGYKHVGMCKPFGAKLGLDYQHVFGTTTSSPKLGCAKFDYTTKNIDSDIAND